MVVLSRGPARRDVLAWRFLALVNAGCGCKGVGGIEEEGPRCRGRAELFSRVVGSSPTGPEKAVAPGDHFSSPTCQPQRCRAARRRTPVSATTQDDSSSPSGKDRCLIGTANHPEETLTQSIPTRHWAIVQSNTILRVFLAVALGGALSHSLLGKLVDMCALCTPGPSSTNAGNGIPPLLI